MAVKAGPSGDWGELCCKMVIETKRVFDGCAFTDENVTLALVVDGQLPQGASFRSARAVSSEFDGYAVENGTGGCCRVSGEIVTRFAVTYEYGGQCATVGATHRESREVMLRLPCSRSLVPYNIEVNTYMEVGGGAIVSPAAVTVNGCLLRIIKVTAPVDILVPTYGYCKYPPCTGGACPGIGGNIFPSFDGGEGRSGA